MTALQSTRPATTGWALTREVGFPVLAAVLTVAYADIRTPLSLPGHRGLIWLTMLVAVTLTSRRRATVLAVGASSTVATMALQLMPNPVYCVRYLAAAVLLYAVAVAVDDRRWAVAVAAAPIHLVAFAGAHHGILGSIAVSEKVMFHLAFGLAAGLLGWAIAAGMDRLSPAGSPASGIGEPGGDLGRP